VVEGLVRYVDTCDPTGVARRTFEVVYGGQTEGGSQVLPTPLNALTQNFPGLAGNYAAKVGGPYPFPILGDVRSSTHVLAANN